MRLLAAAVAAALAMAAVSSEAVACGCLAPPNPASPVVQAGERIIFRVKNGEVTAHIQIQYSGKAEEFGWLLPLPSVPTVEVGFKELFDTLEGLTAPSYQAIQTFTNGNCYNGSSNNRGAGQSGGIGGCGSSTMVTPVGAGCEIDTDCGGHGLCVQHICVVDFREDMAMPSVAVVSDSIGPYDYAVLKADDQAAMLDWLKQSHYYVPAGTDDVLAPYIHPGAYFLALKLHSGNNAGDIQPIVVHYTSDLPMIPLILTAVGAVPDMSVEAFVLGDARAVPRNYYHLVLDEAAVWVGGTTYAQVFRDAVHAAPNRHAFVTEFAQAFVPPASLVEVPEVDQMALGARTDPEAFWNYLSGRNMFGGLLGAATRRVLAAHITEPQRLVDAGVSQMTFFFNMGYWLKYWRTQFPDDPAIEFDAAATAADIVARVVDPARVGAAVVADAHYLTRLRTVLSPEDMTADPVFSFNPSLPEVPAGHTATLERTCYQTSYLIDDPADPKNAPKLRFDPGTLGLPAVLRIERLLEEGPPDVVVDNQLALRARTVAQVVAPDSADSSGGCTVVPAAAHRGMLATLALLGAAALILRARRRR